MSNRLKNIDFSENHLIAANIRHLMKIHDISETQLANSLGISTMTIRRVMSGETEDPRISTLSLIADYFKVTVDSLLDKSKIPFSIKEINKVHFLPILNWNNLKCFFSKEKIDSSTWNKWYPLANSESLKLDDKTFVLESKISMQPRFPQGSLLIISSQEKPQDGDIILLKSRSSEEISIRELTFDIPKWILHPIITGSEKIFFNEHEYNIIGVVILTILPSRS